MSFKTKWLRERADLLRSNEPVGGSGVLGQAHTPVSNDGWHILTKALITGYM